VRPLHTLVQPAGAHLRSLVWDGGEPEVGDAAVGEQAARVTWRFSVWGRLPRPGGEGRQGFSLLSAAAAARGSAAVRAGNLLGSCTAPPRPPHRRRCTPCPGEVAGLLFLDLSIVTGQYAKDLFAFERSAFQSLLAALASARLPPVTPTAGTAPALRIRVVAGAYPCD
jgi:hypothetical protein